MIQLILADDHAMVRAGIRALLEKAGDIYIQAEASDGQQVIELAEKHNPDVILMDVMMPRLNGIQAAEKLRALKIPARVVFLSMYSDQALVYQALQCGARGYLLKTSFSEELLQAVRFASRGEMYLSPVIADMMNRQVSLPHSVDQSNPLQSLSPREKEILKLIAEEHTSSEIGELLFISEKTVEKHRASLMEKLHARNIAGLVRFAIKYGLVSEE